MEVAKNGVSTPTPAYDAPRLDVLELNCERICLTGSGETEPSDVVWG